MLYNHLKFFWRWQKRIQKIQRTEIQTEKKHESGRALQQHVFTQSRRWKPRQSCIQKCIKLCQKRSSGHFGRSSDGARSENLGGQVVVMWRATATWRRLLFCQNGWGGVRPYAPPGSAIPVVSNAIDVTSSVLLQSISKSILAEKNEQFFCQIFVAYLSKFKHLTINLFRIVSE